MSHQNTIELNEMGIMQTGTVGPKRAGEKKHRVQERPAERKCQKSTVYEAEGMQPDVHFLLQWGGGRERGRIIIKDP